MISFGYFKNFLISFAHYIDRNKLKSTGKHWLGIYNWKVAWFQLSKMLRLFVWQSIFFQLLSRPCFALVLQEQSQRPKYSWVWSFKMSCLQRNSNLANPNIQFSLLTLRIFLKNEAEICLVMKLPNQEHVSIIWKRKFYKLKVWQNQGKKRNLDFQKLIYKFFIDFEKFLQI